MYVPSPAYTPPVVSTQHTSQTGLEKTHSPLHRCFRGRDLSIGVRARLLALRGDWARIRCRCLRCLLGRGGMLPWSLSGRDL